MHKTYITKERQDVIVDCLNKGFVSCNKQGDVFLHRGRNGIHVKPKKSHTTKGGNYLRTGIRIGNKRYFFLNHHIVWINFNGFIPEGLQINHKDTNKLNNELGNFELVTFEENKDHAMECGLYHKGEQHKKSKLTEDAVRYIKKHYIWRDKDFGQTALGKMFGVRNTTVKWVIDGGTWKDVV